MDNPRPHPAPAQRVAAPLVTETRRAPLPRISPRQLRRLALASLRTAPSASEVPVPRLAPSERSRVASLPQRPLSEHAAAGFDPGRLPFALTIRDEMDVNYHTFTVFARPGERVALSGSLPLSWEDEAGRRAPSLTLDWTAPDNAGVTQVSLHDAGGHTMRLNLIVMQGLDDSGLAVNGYTIGQYPAEPYQGRANYIAPEHFAEVPPTLESLPVSPHFTLGQFLCKQPGTDARYLVLSERLLAKLEVILEAANARGWRADSFTVMSGYRTPSYNASIGNGQYSRHIYGGAADIFIDTDGDGIMDDLNGDGRTDRADAAALFDLVDALSNQPNFAPYLGGIGEYDSTPAHGPFVHVDERGWRAIWGRPARS